MKMYSALEHRDIKAFPIVGKKYREPAEYQFRLTQKSFFRTQVRKDKLVDYVVFVFKISKSQHKNKASASV